MPTSRGTSSSSISSDAPAAEPAPPPASGALDADDLKKELERSHATTVYLDPHITLTDEQASVAALLKDGIHAEFDVVRGCIAIRAATPEEIAEATAPPAEAEAEPASA